jgi:hypothetical protein
MGAGSSWRCLGGVRIRSGLEWEVVEEGRVRGGVRPIETGFIVKLWWLSEFGPITLGQKEKSRSDSYHIWSVHILIRNSECATR